MKMPSQVYPMYLIDVFYLFFRFIMEGQAEKAVNDAKCEMLKNMISELQCYSCKSVPSPFENGMNRYVCDKRAHSLCENCKIKCSCGSTVTQEEPSNLTKKLLEDLPWYCPHFVYGCQEIMSKDKLENHQSDCAYRPVFCPFYRCNEKLPFLKLNSHIEEKCKNNFFTSKMETEHKYFMWTGKLSRKVAILDLKSKERFFVCDIWDNDSKQFKLWVQFFGPDHVCKKYKFTVSSENNADFPFSFQSTVIPISEKSNDILHNFHILTLSEGIVDKMVGNGKFSFPIIVEIQSIKEEVKDIDVESGVSDVSN